MKLSTFLAFSIISIACYANADGIILDGSKEISNQNFKSSVEVVNPQSPIKNIKVSGDLKIKGSVSLENVSVDGDLECLGSVNIKDASFRSVAIKGNTVLENVKLENITLLGSLEANNIDVDRRAKILGSMRLMNSKLNNLTASSETLTLHNTRVDDLVVTSSVSMREIIDVKGKSKVSEVTFYSNSGTINLYGKDAYIGKVHGGAIVNK